METFKPTRLERSIFESLVDSLKGFVLILSFTLVPALLLFFCLYILDWIGLYTLDTSMLDSIRYGHSIYSSIALLFACFFGFLFLLAALTPLSRAIEYKRGKLPTIELLISSEDLIIRYDNKESKLKWSNVRSVQELSASPVKWVKTPSVDLLGINLVDTSLNEYTHPDRSQNGNYDLVLEIPSQYWTKIGLFEKIQKYLPKDCAVHRYEPGDRRKMLIYLFWAWFAALFAVCAQQFLFGV